MNMYKLNPVLLEEHYRRSYYKLAAVTNVNSTSFLIDVSTVKLRGIELAIFPLEKNYPEFEIETDDPEVFTKLYPDMKIIPRSIFLLALRNKDEAKKAFGLIKSVLETENDTDIDTILKKLDSSSALGRLNILDSGKVM